MTDELKKAIYWLGDTQRRAVEEYHRVLVDLYNTKPEHVTMVNSWERYRRRTIWLFGKCMPRRGGGRGDEQSVLEL